LPAPTQHQALFASPEKRNVVFCLLLAVVTLALYNPVSRYPFINYDDDRYITENRAIHAGLSWGTIRWASTSTAQANWHPLTWLSHALDYQLFHLNAAGHHFTSAVIHALNAMLLFWLLARGTGRAGRSLLVAALFALHPINVESVAWVAERKNVLCTLFFVLAIGAYGWHLQRPSRLRYVAVAALFAFALMSKPMAITLPCVLLLLDFWPLKRAGQTSFTELLLEKLPLLALSVASAVITVQAQQAGGAVRSTQQFPLGVRGENAIVAYATYLWKMIWPARLAPLYPHPGDALAVWQVVVSALTLLAITGFVLRFRSKRYLLMGWLWFLGTLVPVIGLVQVGDAAMADRYAYIPLIGIFIMIAFGLSDLADARRLGLAPGAITAAGILLALALTTHRQLNYWSSSYDLWAHTLQVTENNFIAQDNLGGALLLMGRAEEAYPHFQAAAEINPRDPMSHSNLGAYLQEHGRLREAVEQHLATIRLTTDTGLLASTYANLGSTYRDLGDDRNATESYDQAIRLNPGQFNAYLGLGRLQERQGNLSAAISNYYHGVALHPTDQGYLQLGRALERAHLQPEALAAYREALKLNPDLKEAQEAVNALPRDTP
jgi:tetratricopeptide (TPR) repeat protein